MENKTTILLAEDEPSLGQIIKESLETRGFDVLLCENGEEAFEIYKTKTPKLLVLDIMMPKKDGFTLAKEVRLENDDIPIIFLTSKSQTQDVVEGFHIGGNVIIFLISLSKHFNLKIMFAHNLHIEKHIYYFT